jgi:tripartite-type tricarboxylate transporter receptor subunit TctC
MKKLLAALLLAPIMAFAWTPEKPIEGVMGFGPGSVNEIVFRTLAKEVEKNTKATFTIVNKGGAGGVVGTEELSKRPADGYSVTMVSVGGLVAMDKVTVPGEGRSYTTDSFVYPLHGAVAPFVIIANTEDKVNTPAKFVEALKKEPLVISASGGARLVFEELSQRVKFTQDKDHVVRIEHKSPQDTLNDVAGGHVRFGIIPAGIAYSFYKDNRVTVVAVTSLKAIPQMKAEPMSAALPKFDVTADWGLMLPKGTPPDVVNWYVTEFGKAFKSPEVKAVFENNLLQEIPSLHTPETFGAFIKAKEKEFKPLVDVVLNSSNK